MSKARMNLRAGIALVLAAGAAACGQSIVNGTFDDGTLTGWTVANTANGTGAPGDVVMIDIDGPGPLGDSNAAHFMVGAVTVPPFNQEGIEMSKSLNLTSGVAYTLGLDWSAQRLAPGTNAEGGVFTILFN